MKMDKSSKCLAKKKIEKIALKLLNSNQEWKNRNLTLKSRNKIYRNKFNENFLSRDTQKDILTLAIYDEKINNNKKLNIKNDNNYIDYNKKFFNYYSVNNNEKSNCFKSIKEEDKEATRKKSQIPKIKKL